MPAEGLLQRFHDLAEVDEEVRCRAAVGVREDLVGSTNEEDLQYTLRRLVRGVQSSRQCCRQGFSLALSEVLAAFPDELSAVLDLIRQHTELQVGLKHSEMKDRLLGRLFAYAAVLQADCLKSCSSSAQSQKNKRSSQGALGELGKGLHEIFAMRPYLKAPSARMVADVVAELVAGGLVAKVPELLEPWTLEDKATSITSNDSAPDVYIVGLLLELRALYVRAEQAGNSPDALKAWPACIRKDALAKPPGPEGLAQAVGKELASVPISDGMSWVAAPFCSWWLQASKQKDGFQDQVWPKLHSLLFPEKATPIAEAQGFRALAELASRLHEAGLVEAEGKNGNGILRAERLLAGLFQNMPRGLTLLFRSLNWQKAQTHPAALFAQNSLVKAVGAPLSQPSGKKRKGKAVSEQGGNQAALPMTDETRLAILGEIQKQKSFGTMNGKYQRMWQQALLAPLSSEGVRSRCTSILESLMSGVEENDLSKKRLYADQLVQLATHSQAPDEVVLAALCLLLTESYFSLTGIASDGPTFSLQKFRASVGLDISCSGSDLVIPVLSAAKEANSTNAGEDEDDDAEKKKNAVEAHRRQWRLKLWSALTGLCRRMSPEQAAKLVAAANAAGDDAGVRTFAFHGCLSDGSLWAMRMHEWWDHIATNADAQASPRMTPKKKRKAEKGVLQCIVPLSAKDISLRKRCIDCCRAVLSEPENDESLPKRQRNALCGLPLVLALALLEDDNDDEAEDPLPVREHLEEFVEILDKLPSTSTLPEAPKQRAKALATLQQERAKVLAQVPLIAAELFVQSNRLVKEAARAAWRELSEFTSDETLTSLCGSIRDAPVDEEEEAEKEGDGEGSEEEDEEEDEGHGNISAANAAKIARLNKATEALKAARAAESAENPSKADDDEDDEIMLDGEAVWEQLLDDGGGGENGLLASFASSGLEGAEATGNKLSKRQQRLRQRQEELMRKFREVELLELFVQKCAEKRPIVAKLLQELLDALLSVGRRAGGSQEHIGGTEQDSGGTKAKKKTKADSQLQRMEKELMLRLSGVLSKVLKQVCRGAVISAACQWHSAAEWKERAEALATLSSSPSSSAAGQRPAEVGAVLLYWFCALHRARSSPSTVSEASGWDLGNDMLRGALQDWGSKKGSDRWCQAFLGAFALRVPQALMRLPWAEHIRSSRNMFVQREQISFVTNQLLRGLSPETAGTTEFTASFAVLCSDLLDNTLETTSAGEQKNGASASQKQKMRREVLRSLAVLLKARHKKAHRHQSSATSPALSEEVGRKISATIKKVRDALPTRRGEVYQLCLHVLRALNGPKKEGGNTEEHGRTAIPSKRERVEENAEGSEVASKKSGKKTKTNAGQQTKGSKGFFGDM